MLVRIVSVFFVISLCNAGPFDAYNRTKRLANDCRPIDLTHTADAYASDGRPCMNDCEGGYCLTSIHDCVACSQGTKKSPTYYTSQRVSPAYTKCLSRCGKFGERFNWCYVNNDEAWDYCNPDTERRQTTVDFGDNNYGPCITACSAGECATYWRSRVRCSNPKETYDQVESVTGEECYGKCAKQEHKLYYWCYTGKYSSLQEEYCAPTAKYND